MKKNILVLAALLVSAITAQAEIPSEIYEGLTCQPQIVKSQNSDGVVIVTDAVLCRTLYSDIQLVEVVVKNLSFDKKIFVYDRAETYEFDRNVKVHLVQSRFDLNDGAALYLGTTPEGYDRFVISLYSVRRPRPAPAIDIYVQMSGQQFAATTVQVQL